MINEVRERNIEREKKKKKKKREDVFYFSDNREKKQYPLPRTMLLKNFLTFKSQTQEANAYLFTIFQYLFKSLFVSFCI